MAYLTRIQDCEIGEGGEYISDFIGYRNVGHGTKIESSRLRITEELSVAMYAAVSPRTPKGFTPVDRTPRRLYNKQFICVAKQVRSTWLVPRDAHGKSTEGSETQMVFIYHHDFTDYLVNVTVDHPDTDS